MKTYLKWVGNKTKLLPKLNEYLPETFGNYHEIFLGSGAIFFWIAASDSSSPFEIGTDRQYFLSDINAPLINCHVVVANNYELLTDRLKHYESNDSKDFYNKCRKVKMQVARIGENIDAAARFIYLNRRAYGGMYRENSKGEFNVPYCDSQTSNLTSKSMRLCSKILRKASIECCGYSDCDAFEPGDFVFIDPPYYPLSDSASFTSYSAGSWQDDDHQKLFAFIRDLDSKGVLFMMTNTYCDFVLNAFNGFNVNYITTKRYIDALTYGDGKNNKEARDTVREAVVTNYKGRG